MRDTANLFVCLFVDASKLPPLFLMRNSGFLFGYVNDNLEVDESECKFDKIVNGQRLWNVSGRQS